MKKIADLLVTVALVCGVLLFQLVQAQGRGLRNPVVMHRQSIPHKCIAPTTQTIPVTSVTAPDVVRLDPWSDVFSLGWASGNQPFYSLLQTPNPIDDTRFFVRQHYRDFLVRDPPDQPGWDFWSGQITQCGSDAACIARKRIDVSRAFFFDDNFADSQFPINPDLKSPRGMDTYNRAFVRQCYLTYLRREPNAPPDNNFGGFDFWLGVLNSHGSPTPTEGYNHLIEAFLLSIEYRNRFVSPPC
jgi:hypothetical protein